jgi:hypothetical protein
VIFTYNIFYASTKAGTLEIIGIRLFIYLPSVENGILSRRIVRKNRKNG